MAKNLIRTPESLSVWENNMEKMRIRQPNLARMLEDYVGEHGHAFEHWENETSGGTWVEGLTPAPFFQAKEAPKFPWDKKRDKTTPAYFLYGIGIPPYLFQAIRSLPGEALSLIVVEPDIALLAYTLHLTHVYTAIGDEGTSLTFYTLQPEAPGEEEEAAEQRRLKKKILLEEAMASGLSAYGVYVAASAKSFAHPGEAESVGKHFTEIAGEIREWATVRLAILGNCTEDTLLGLRQMALMTPWILNTPSLDILRNAYEGKPCVCVAAGPSLDKNLHQLKEVQDRCLIVAADAVLRKLLINGIRPHIVTALERGVTTYDCFFSAITEEFPEECAKILLVAQSVCVPQIAGRWPGPKVLVGKQGLPADEWFVGELLGGNLLPSGGSVAHMNYTLAVWMGAESAAIIGQDLAFGEDGSTHAGDTAREDVMEITKRSISRQKIPAALGGEVETEAIWLMFLRGLEEYIQQLGLETWDCTEGGALIAGTKIHPLKEYIDGRIRPSEPLETTPARLISESSREPDAEMDVRFAEAYEHLALSGRILDAIEKEMELVTAPALTPQQRVRSAKEVAQLLDALHGVHDVLSFIGQSHIYLASIELAQTRLLDDVATVERWEKMHRDIVEAHRLTLRFIERWLRYADSIRALSLDKAERAPLTGEEAREALRTLLEAEEEGLNGAFAMDLLLARCDLLRSDVSGYALWGAAVHLMSEGRAQEALAHMKRAAELFENAEMPREDIVRFFKDYARVWASHDLCHYPDYQQAETVISNALELEPQDAESRQILGDILDGLLSFSSAVLGDSSEKWLACRAAGVRALARGDLVGALEPVWEGIREYWLEAPGWAASHLHWLVLTLVNVRHAQDPAIRSTASRILQELAGSGILESIQLPYPPEVVELFASYGVQVDFFDEGEAP